MDFDAIADKLPIIVTIVILILVQFFMRRGRKPEVAQRDVVQSLLSEVRLNLAIIEIFTFDMKTKKFEVTSWRRNKDKLGFLDQQVQTALADAFTLIEDFNQQIDAARRSRSSSYLGSIDVKKLQKPLNRSREGLEAWLQSGGGESAPDKPSGLSDIFLGGR